MHGTRGMHNNYNALYSNAIYISLYKPTPMHFFIAKKIIQNITMCAE